MMLFWLSAVWLVGIWVGSATSFAPLYVLLFSALCAVIWLRLRSYRAPCWIFGLLLTNLALVGNLARVERCLLFVEADALLILIGYVAGL